MDSEMIKKLGTSLTVPSVQELVKKSITKVPERYIQQNQEPPHVVSSIISLPQVPVIDLNKLLTEEDGNELEKLDHACKEWGFFQTNVIIYYIV
ncbi:hypothetical protein TSUD_217830 [Trifolium subterraneum]|uniref:Non-haem dioxygenase N-terminal domain-containing protein n=1 Tax=Trifolium subterraneum TaxID=3900 RepID=A0A2Z6NFM7_TRISU|nr:hypothetical protein TSUD_217830 [Trifolium subterraneum]